jgi:peptidoglycan/LPS O-acetylase OafA/YrhL
MNLRRLLFDPLRSGQQTPQQSQERIHFVELDSLRGLAAMSVLLLHFLEGWLEASPPHFVRYLGYIPLLTNGSAAVVLFFVLSGFVLTLPQMAPQPQSYPAYVIRRICRIYLPYLAALVLSILGCWRFHGLEMYGIQFHLTWRNPPSAHLIAEHLAFLGRYDVYAYDSPIWSLVHEMRISLIFPVLCLISLRLRAWLAFLVALTLPVIDRIIERLSGPYLGEGYPGVQSVFWSYTVGFCGIFLVGSLLARYREPIVAWLARLSAWTLSVLSLLALVLYQYASLLHIPRFLWDFTVGLGGAYFVMLALVPNSWLSRFLHLGPIRWLGSISYSLYLLHVPVLLVVSILLYRKVPDGVMLATFLVLSLLAAAAFHRVVELPSIRLGRTLANRLDKRIKPSANEASPDVMLST